MKTSNLMAICALCAPLCAPAAAHTASAAQSTPCATAVQTAGIYGYDLYNEPVQKREAAPGCDWWDLQRRAAEAVRAEDPHTPIIVESNHAASPRRFDEMKPFALTNVIYQFHIYWPDAFTHQRVLGTRQWTVEYLDLPRLPQMRGLERRARGRGRRLPPPTIPANRRFWKGYPGIGSGLRKSSASASPRSPPQLTSPPTTSRLSSSSP